MDRRPSLPALVAGLLVAFTLPALAQEQEGAGDAAREMAAMMEAYMKAGTPGEPHAALAKMAGQWEGTLKMWMDPSAPPMENTFTSSTEMIMGGRYLLENVEGQFMGQTFEGAGVTGYNNTTGQYEAAWIDNMGTTIYRYTGEMNDAGELVLHSTFKDPTTGETVKSRTIRKMVSEDEMLETGYESRSGYERKTMEIRYRRSG